MDTSIKAKKKNTSPTMTADKTAVAVKVVETAITEERIVPNIPKNRPPKLQRIQFFILEWQSDTAEAMITVKRNTMPVINVDKAAVNGAVRIALVKRKTARAAITIPLMIPIRIIIPDMQPLHCSGERLSS